MDRYDSFEMFMVDVTNKANELYDNTYDELIHKYNMLINYGWWLFKAVCVKSVGDEFEPKYKAANGNHTTIDNLYKQAVSSLLHRANKSIPGNILTYLNSWGASSN